MWCENCSENYSKHDPAVRRNGYRCLKCFVGPPEQPAPSWRLPCASRESNFTRSPLHAPIAPLPEVIESSTDEAWELFDAAQRARDPAPGAKPTNQPTEGTK